MSTEQNELAEWVSDLPPGVDVVEPTQADYEHAKELVKAGRHKEPSRPIKRATPGGIVPGAQTAPLETATLTIANGGVNSTAVEIGNPTDIGLLVPTITSATITVQVSLDNVTYFGVVDKAGVATLVLAASTGAYGIDCNSLGAVLAYKFLRVVAGAAQGAERTLTVFRKISRTDPTV